MKPWPPRAFPAAPTLVVGAALLAASCSHGGKPTPEVSAVERFETVRAVLQSPRCANCHPPGDAPLQGDDGHLHLQNVQRGPEGRGVAGFTCMACHGKANPPASYGPGQPPGVSTEWHLPPPQTKMVFVGLDAHTLCEQLKDPERTGGKDLVALLHHVSGDPLVLWGWSPGFGRKAVPIAHEEFVAAFKAWAESGAPCPPQ